MSRSLSTLTYAAIGVAAAITLAGCGAGQITQTDTEVSAVNGASGNVGQIAVRDTAIVFTPSTTAAIYPPGSAAPLQGAIANFGNADDKLVSVSSPVAGSVSITGNVQIFGGRLLVIDGKAPGTGAGASGTATPSTAPATTAPATPSATSSAGAASATPSATSSAGAAATPTEPIGQPQNAQTGTSTASIVLTGLKQDIKAGPTYPVVFKFQLAGEVTLQVPVANPAGPRPGSTTG